MENTQEITESPVSRKNIAIRLLYTVMYLIIFEILKTIVQVVVLFQYIYLFITRKYSSPLRSFSNKVATYAYKIIRYATLNDNLGPFPFHEFPEEMEKPADHVIYD